MGWPPWGVNAETTASRAYKMCSVFKICCSACCLATFDSKLRIMRAKLGRWVFLWYNGTVWGILGVLEGTEVVFESLLLLKSKALTFWFMILPKGGSKF